MYHMVEVECPDCGRKQRVNGHDAHEYTIGCVCGGSMEPTGGEEYDDDFACESDERGGRIYGDYDDRGY